MTTDEPQAHENGILKPGKNESTADFDAYQSFVRLLVGGAIEGSDALVQRLRAWENIHPASPDKALASSGETAKDQAVYVALALVFASAEVARRGAARMGRASARFGRVWLKAMLPVRKGLGMWVNSHETDLERWIQTGRAEAIRSRSLARYMLTNTIDEVVGYLSGSQTVNELIVAQLDALLKGLPDTPQLDGLVQGLAGNYLEYLQENPDQVDGLVQQLAGNYLTYLQEHPEAMGELIRKQGDEYIEYLNANPEKVQTLIAGQSTGLATEFLEEVRERTVSADNVFETITRAILRKPQREVLSEPPPLVQRRAEKAILPNDLERKPDE